MSQHDECKKEIADLKRVVYGDASTGKGGLAHIVDMLGETVYGGKTNPSGLVSDVAAIKRAVWMVGGGVIVAQFALQILFKFWP
jgi:hypothetical protein